MQARQFVGVWRILAVCAVIVFCRAFFAKIHSHLDKSDTSDAAAVDPPDNGFEAGPRTRLPSDRPNVVIILSDDQGFSDVGFNGCRDIPTPHIDSIAADGVKFTNAYVAHPTCSPSRAGLLTGRHPQRIGHEYNPESRDDGLPLDQITLADVLRSEGYATGMIGKWHLGQLPTQHPNQRGFTYFYGFLGGESDYLHDDQRKGAQAILRNGQVMAEREYLTDAFTREATDFIDRHHRRPFFLCVAYNAVHVPHQAPPSYLDRFRDITDDGRRVYAAMTAALDDGIGKIPSKLDEHEVAQNTVVFYLTDNGGATNNYSEGGSLRAKKGTLYEGGIRVPFALRWNGTIPAGSIVDEPVTSLDIFPTAVAAAGIKPSDAHLLDGVNLLPYVGGRTNSRPHDALFWRVHAGLRFAVRQGDYKLVGRDDGSVELFNLRSDVGETSDISATNRDIVESMLHAYAQWDATTVPPLWEPKNSSLNYARRHGTAESQPKKVAWNKITR